MSALFENNYFLYIPVAALVVVFFYQMYLRLFPHTTEEVQYAEEQRKKEVTRVISSQKDRELTECIDEEAFWELIERARKRAKDTYKGRLGVLRDVLSLQLSPEELIRFDNRYNALLEDNLSHDVIAASTIFFGERSLYYAFLLMNVFILEGRIFFNNACTNPNLIIGKNFKEIVPETIDGHVADLYFRKTQELIPIYKPYNEEMEIPGKPWEMRDLPRRYPELWEAFA
jgi:hypothetical protein